MSGLYALGIIALWIALTGLLWEAWRRSRAVAGKKHGRTDAVFAVVALIWLATSFWFGGGRKFYYDAKVKRLCAQDGGIRVHEKVALPAEKFDRYGVVRIPTKEDAKAEDEYFYEWEVHRYRDESPSMRRDRFLIFRRADSKLLGEAVSYARRGGDMPGPWHPSSFRCPAQADDVNLRQQIFIFGSVEFQVG